jgi:predicted transposase YbfD/YdcC
VDAQALLDAVAPVLGAAVAAALLQESCAAQEGGARATGKASCSSVCSSVEPLRALRHLACDGKELRGSYRLTATGVQPAQGVLTIYDVASGRTEAFLPIDGKGFEAKALRSWLAAHSAAQTLTGCLVTADALHTQSRVCKAMCMAGADYLLLVKQNQRQLHEEIGYLFSQPPDFWFPERRAERVEKGHGRIQVRTLRASDELNDYLADRWPGVAQVFQIERSVTRRTRQGTRKTVEIIYGLTSVAARHAPPDQLLAWVQAHWCIENRNHWRRDATLGEDRLQLSHQPAALVMAALNCILLALFDHLHHANCRKAMRLYNAHPEQALALLCQPL